MRFSNILRDIYDSILFTSRKMMFQGCSVSQGFSYIWSTYPQCAELKAAFEGVSAVNISSGYKFASHIYIS